MFFERAGHAFCLVSCTTDALGPYERFKQIQTRSVSYAVEHSTFIHHECAFDFGTTYPEDPAQCVPQELVLYHTRRLCSPLTTQMPHCVCHTKRSIVCVQLDNANAVLWTTELRTVVYVTAPMNQVCHMHIVEACRYEESVFPSL